MDLVFLISDLETHRLSNISLINELKKRGHNINVVKLPHDKSTNKAVDFIEPKQVVAVERLTEKLENNTSILILHGISIYKNNYIRTSKQYDKILVPTKAWITEREKRLNKVEKNKFYYSNGWNKLDIYYRYLKNQEKIKKEIYKKYKLDKNKKLAIYSPTGHRTGYETLEKWEENGWSKESYQDHGTGYLKQKVIEKIKKHTNIYTIDHPCVNRSDITKDRLKFMAIADIFIGDISSTTLEFSVMNKPIIQIMKNKKDRLDGDFNVFHNTSSEVLDFGPIVSLDDLEDVFKENLIKDTHQERRNYLKNKYVGTFDGKCAKREADTMEQIWLEQEKK